MTNSELINSLKDIATTDLENTVAQWVIEKSEDYDEINDVFQDLLQSGCASGMVSNLIYYNDTLAFYETHKADIQSLLTSSMGDAGIYSPDQLFGDKWDTADVFANETQNQNLLAWYGFEETAFLLASQLGLDI